MRYNKNDLVTITIEDIGHDGAGIGKIEGFIIFTKDAVIGDIVRARIMKVKSSFAYAKLEEVVTPSSFRVIPLCSFHRQCGGCQLQTLSYEKQLEYKQNKIRNNLIRIGGFASDLIDNVMQPIVGMEEPWFYRNKAQYPVGYDKLGKPITGFYAGRTHDIIANTDCLLGDKRNKEILEIVLAYMKANQITAYDEKTGTGLFRHILIRNGFYSGEVMVSFIVNSKHKIELKKQHELVEALSKIPGMTSICINLNPERTNVIMGNEVHVLWGQGFINDTLHVNNERKLNFQISPKSFYQVNPRQTEKLYNLVLEYADLKGFETVWDLYSGIGTISLFMAAVAGKVYGVEVIKEAVDDARMNAHNNGFDNTEFYSGNVEDILTVKCDKADVIIVDPPRKGCEARCLEAMIKAKPDRIIYVSCDSATLARDLQFLCNNGYELKRVQAVDQFPQTVHVETICVIAKSNVSQASRDDEAIHPAKQKGLEE